MHICSAYLPGKTKIYGFLNNLNRPRVPHSKPASQAPAWTFCCTILTFINRASYLRTTSMASVIETALELLEQKLPGRVATPSSVSAYEKEKDRPWSVQLLPNPGNRANADYRGVMFRSSACWTPAAAYILLKSAEDVAVALSIVRETGCKFVVRSTGNNANVGFSNTDETGLVLDLRGLAGMSLDSSGCLHLGAGTLWDDIYPFLEGHHRSAIGGRQGGAGLGGFLLGGLSQFPALFILTSTTDLAIHPRWPVNLP